MKHVVESLLSCSTAPENWGAALDAFNDTFDVSASCMFSIHEFREFRMNFEWSDFHRKHLPPEVLERLLSGDDQGDARGYQTLFQNPPQRFYHEMDLFGVKRYEDLPHSDIRDVTENQGFIMRCAAALNPSGPWIDGFFCHHRKQAQWQGFMADKRTEVILPIMSNSVSLGRMLQALRARYNAALSVLDALGLGVFLVDRTGCVIEHNGEAQRILDQSDGLTLTKSKRITLHATDRTNALSAMVDAANGLLKGDITQAHSLLTAPRPSGAYDYLVSVRALSDETAELEAGLNCAFVTVIDPARDNHLSSEGVTALGQLSEAESAIVDLLIQGFRPAEVANQRDVSLNTVKTQLKTISQKLRCSTQSDIIRAAAATRVPLGK